MVSPLPYPLHVSILPISPYTPSHALLSFSSLPSPQIRFDSLSLPGLNHQGPLVGPNQGPVSPQRGFCLLAVETNDLHRTAAPRHLEAVIAVIRSTWQGTACRVVALNIQKLVITENTR